MNLCVSAQCLYAYKLVKTHYWHPKSPKTISPIRSGTGWGIYVVGYLLAKVISKLSRGIVEHFKNYTNRLPKDSC